MSGYPQYPDRDGSDPEHSDQDSEDADGEANMADEGSSSSRAHGYGGGADKDEVVGGMSVLVCGHPFEHRAQSAHRRAKSAQLRRSADTVKLAGVKTQLYNPALPSLRRMDMDDVEHRLAPEHSRATSALTRRGFSECRTTFFEPAKRFPSNTVTESSRPLERRLRTLSASAPTRPIPWKSLLDSFSSPVRPAPAATAPVRNVAIFGYTTRHLNPQLSRSYKLNLEGTCGVDRRTSSQHLVPSDINYRYRTRSPQYTQRASTAPAWH